MPSRSSLFNALKTANRSAPSLASTSSLSHTQHQYPAFSIPTNLPFLPAIYISEPEEEGGDRWCAFSGNAFGSPWSSGSGSPGTRGLLDVPIPDIAALEETIARLREGGGTPPVFCRPTPGVNDSDIVLPKRRDSTATWEEINLSAEERRSSGAWQSKRRNSAHKLMSMLRGSSKKQQQPQQNFNTGEIFLPHPMSSTTSLNPMSSTETIQPMPFDPMSSVETFRPAPTPAPASPPAPVVKRKRRSLALLFKRSSGGQNEPEESMRSPTRLQMFSADDLSSSGSAWMEQSSDAAYPAWQDDVQTSSGHSDPLVVTPTEEKPLPALPSLPPKLRTSASIPILSTPSLSSSKSSSSSSVKLEEKEKKKVVQNDMPLPVTGKRRFSLKPLRNAFKPTPTGVVIVLPPEEDSGLSSSSEDSASSQRTFRPFGFSRRTAFPSFEVTEDLEGLPAVHRMPTKLESLHFDELRFDPRRF